MIIHKKVTIVVNYNYKHILYKMKGNSISISNNVKYSYCNIINNI